MYMNRIPNKIITYSGLIVLIIVIGILSMLFHQSIQIIDALSSEPVHGFGIHISFWRIIFEPFAGPLLFYLRADQPLLEFAILFLWIIVFSLMFTLLRLFLPGKKAQENPNAHGLLLWLKSLLLIVATWLGLLWLIIYLPLPANTIVNHNEQTILINTHSHTEFSHDGIISTKRLQLWHKKNGFDAFFLTDHNHHKHTMEAVRAQDQGRFPEEPLMIVGEEFSGSNHMTLLGLKRNFITRGLSDQQVIDSTHEDQGVVIVAHWFDGERESIPFFLDMGVDGFEIANQGSGLKYEERIFSAITEACTSKGLIMTGVVDYHGYGSSCFAWTALEIPGWHQMDPEQKRESIMQVLRGRDMSRIRVLLYHDRNVFDRSRVLLSPLYSFVGYFRTLNILQLLSWILWLILLVILRSRLVNRIKGSISFRCMQTVALMSGLFLLTNGVLFLFKARRITEYNEIYAEYSTYLLCGGAFILIYSFLLIFVEHKKKANIKNQ